MDKKDIVFNFIKKQRLAVISTNGINEYPESAVLEFGQTVELELIFDTFTSSRKYKNLLRSKNVSFVIGWDEDITVQYEGKATELKNNNALEYKNIYWNKNPKAKRWESRDGITYFIVTPHWIRYSDLRKDPWNVFEISFS